MTSVPDLAIAVQATDCDLRNSIGKLADLGPYLTAETRELLDSMQMHEALPFASSSGIAADLPGDVSTGVASAAELAGVVFGPDSPLGRGVLTYDERLRAIGKLPNPYLAAEFAHAVNEWLAAEWLDRDDRFLGSVLVSNQLPDQAAAEIRYWAADNRFVQVILANNGLGKPYGHPAYQPIFAAAAETGMPLCITANGIGGAAPSPLGGGLPSTLVELEVLASQAIMTHLVSFMTQGVFEQFPALRLVVSGAGQGWYAPFLWRFDSNYKGVRREVPWLKSSPSEHFGQHVRVTTAGLDAAYNAAAWLTAVRAMGGSDVLMYGSDRPGESAAGVAVVDALLPDGWRNAVLESNAAEWYARAEWPHVREPVA